MKKNVISLSIAALLAGFAGSALAAGSVWGTGNPNAPTTTSAANAAGGATPTGLMHRTDATGLVFNGDGIGHILLVPYYTAQNGNATLLTLTNTDTINGKAVKIRFRSAANSDDVRDFQIYLSPGDVWTAEINESASGEAQILFSDKSCTAPATGISGVPFSTFRFEGASWSDAEKKAHTREGYVEIFNMADIPPFMASNWSSRNHLYHAVKHVGGVAPCRSYTNASYTESSDPISRLHLDATPKATESELEALGLNTPTTGLMGSAIILNRLTGYVSWTDNAEAVVAVDATNTAASGRNVFAMQTDTLVDNDDAEALTNDPLLRRQYGLYLAGAPSAPDVASAVTAVPVADPVEWDFPDLSTPYFTQLPLSVFSNAQLTIATGAVANPLPVTFIAPWDQADMLTRALAVDSVINEFVTDPSIGAATDWTFSMPTRRYHVAVDYENEVLVFNRNDVVLNTQPAGGTNAASTSRFFAGGTGGNVLLTEQYACITGITVASRGREEETSSAASGEGPSPGGGTNALAFCGEVSVLGFYNTDTLYSTAGIRYDVSPSGGYRDGWARIATPGRNANGLPVLGAAYTKLIGEDVGTKSTNYGVHVRHRYTR